MVLDSRISSGLRPGGKICSMGTMVSSVNNHRDSTCDRVMPVRTDTVVMLRLPSTSSVSVPVISTTSTPSTSPRVLNVGPGPSAA